MASFRRQLAITQSAFEIIGVRLTFRAGMASVSDDDNPAYETRRSLGLLDGFSS
jgi:hypothetical protein